MTQNESIALVEEQARLEKRRVETGKVLVRISTTTQEHLLHEVLHADVVSIERRELNLYVDEPPQTRQEGDVLVVPVVEEVIVKRFLVREEVRITRRRIATPIEETAPLRSQTVTIERRATSGDESQVQLKEE